MLEFIYYYLIIYQVHEVAGMKRIAQQTPIKEPRASLTPSKGQRVASTPNTPVKKDMCKLIKEYDRIKEINF